MVSPTKALILLAVLSLFSVIVVSADPPDEAGHLHTNPREQTVAVNVDSNSEVSSSLITIPEPSITLLVAAGSFVYLLRWRGGRDRRRQRL